MGSPGQPPRLHGALAGQAPCLLLREARAAYNLFEGQRPAPLKFLSLAFWPLAVCADLHLTRSPHRPSPMQTPPLLSEDPPSVGLCNAFSVKQAQILFPANLSCCWPLLSHV